MQLTLNNGWLENITLCPSPNFNARPIDTSINLIVIHNISLPPEQFGQQHVEDFFCNKLNVSAHPYFEKIKHLEVSAHCLIKRTGTIVQCVNFNDRAWHAGASIYEGRDNCNDYSIGIELEGTDFLPYTSAQYQQLIALCQLLLSSYTAITPERITGHNVIAPERKTDPGQSFNWDFFRHGLKNPAI